jgi:ERCC4-related helicase
MRHTKFFFDSSDIGRSDMTEVRTQDILQRFQNVNGAVDVLVGTSLVEGLDLSLFD